MLKKENALKFQKEKYAGNFLKKTHTRAHTPWKNKAFRQTIKNSSQIEKMNIYKMTLCLAFEKCFFSQTKSIFENETCVYKKRFFMTFCLGVA